MRCYNHGCPLLSGDNYCMFHIPCDCPERISVSEPSGPMLGCPSADGQAADEVNRADVRAVCGTDITTGERPETRSGDTQ